MLEMLDLTGDSSDDELSPSVASSPRSKVSPSTTKSFSTAPRPSSSRKLSEGPSVEAQAPSKKRKTSSENGSIAKSGSGASAASGAKSTTSSTASPVVVPKSTFPIFAFAQRSTSTSSISSNSSPRPTQRAFYHTGSPDSPSLPFSTLTLAYTRPDNGKVVRGDDLKLSAFDVFGYGGGTNERGIVATMRLKLDFIGDLVGAGDVQSSSTGNQAGIGIGKPLLLIYDKMDLPSGVGEGAFAVGPIVLHRAPCKFGPVGTHAKLAILARKAPNGTPYLRIAIPTANFNGPLSWDGAENAVFIQDFPLLSNSMPVAAQPEANPTHTPFSLGLLKFLKSVDLPLRNSRASTFLNLFSTYDFTDSNQGRLVHSLSGKFATQAFDAGKEGGLGSLAAAVKELKSFDGGDWKLECMGSSLGRLPRSFLEDLFTAAQGFEPRLRHGKKSAHLLAPFDPTKIKVVYPCEADLDSKEESSNAASAPHIYHFNDGSWDSLPDDDLRAELLHRSCMKSGRVVTHTKTILIVHTSTDPSAEHEAFLYVGSHNVTIAAWGDYSSSEQVLIRQFELGVMIRLASPTAQGLDALIDSHLPYDRPLAPYGAGDRPFEPQEDRSGKSAKGKGKGSW